ncbi:TIGR03089 family protein [Rhodococcus rhodnii]|nr:TIGR03089 family protein [Rhodococcus rhodnii]TXG92588.1 TIGR03089 family protein [Rhodococcus rhodnii]
MPATLTDALLDPALTRDPAGPRITWYDDATGERIELSAVTLANWAAKTANLLRDEIGIAPGDRVAVLLPAHWQTAAVLLGVWWAGAEAVLDADDTDVAAALVTADGLDSDAPEVVALSLHAFGLPVPDLPLGIVDYATAVRVHGDAFSPAGAGAALSGMSVAEIATAAADAAERSGLTAADRVLSSRTWSTADDLVESLLAPLVAGASLVQVAHPDPDRQERRVETEKVTRSLS